MKRRAPYEYLYPREKVANKRKLSAIFWNSKNLDNCLQVVNSLSRLQMVYGGSYNERAPVTSPTQFSYPHPTPPPPPRHAHYADGVKISWFFRLSQREMLLLTGVRDLGKGQSSVERTPKYHYMSLLMECGWRGRGRWGGSLCDSETSFQFMVFIESKKTHIINCITVQYLFFFCYRCVFCKTVTCYSVEQCPHHINPYLHECFI
jgi:hypothetical protein